MRSYLTHLECARCGKEYSCDVLQNLCSCGSPLLARYDFKKVGSVVSRQDFGFRVHNMWRFKELLPVRDPANVVTLYEGFTPMFRSCSIGPALGLENLWFKDESMNPTDSFKARGMSVAISKAKELGVQEVALPT